MEDDISAAVVAKDGNLFAVTRRDGSFSGGALGVYLDDARVLSVHELRLDGVALRAVAAHEAGAATVHALAGPGVEVDLRRVLDGAGALREEVEVRASAPLDATLDLDLDADFAPMLALRGHAPLAPGRAERRGSRFERRGRDGVVRGTTVRADPPLPVALRLAAGERARVTIECRFYGGAPGRRPAAEPAPLRVADPAGQRAVDRALQDLRTLRSERDGLPYLAAGVPWYATLFGRDSLIAALQTLPLWPDLAAGTLRLLAAHLGARVDPAREEEPGKVLHELRPGEAAAADLTPLARYYGSVDATPLWLCLLAAHPDGGALLAELRPQVDAMLAWLDRDELLTYAPHAPGGLRNQGWKDSPDGVCHADGTPLEPPIALVEAQGYAIRARRGLADLHERAGDGAAARRLRAGADAHAARLERFWLPERGFYAMALDRDGRPSDALASNQGHLLWAGALAPERARAVRDALMSAEAFSGWGIRTLAAGQGAYDARSYHRGSVWPHDTALIAAGLRAYGFAADADRLTERLVAAALAFPDQRLPELFAGTSGSAPEPYRAACRPQAWAAGALVQLLAEAA